MRAYTSRARRFKRASRVPLIDPNSPFYAIRYGRRLPLPQWAAELGIPVRLAFALEMGTVPVVPESALWGLRRLGFNATVVSDEYRAWRRGLGIVEEVPHA